MQYVSWAELTCCPVPGGVPTEPMVVTMMKAKIHRATVTQADIEYEGSIAIDSAMLRETGILPNEQVHVFDINNGSRFVTYAIEAPRGSRTICVNGAAARLVSPGNRVIIVAYAQMTDQEARDFVPRVLLLGERNELRT